MWCFLLLSLVGFSLATGPDSAQCYTFYGSTAPTRVKTAWQTHYTPCTTTKTSTVLVSSRAAGSTFTTTVTSYSTFKTGTSTVPASSGFLPVRSTLPGSSYNGSEGTSPLRREANDADLVARKAGTGPSGFFAKNGLKPTSVGCQSWTHSQCKTKTTVTTSTTTLPPTVSPIVVTKTVNATTTVSSTTVYAACASDNYAAIYNVNQVSGSQSNFAGAGYDTHSPYDCCVAALNFPTATGIATTFGYEIGVDSGCFILYTGSYPNGGSCPNGQVDNIFAETTGDYPYFVAGNAYCGEIVPPVANRFH